VGDLFQPHRFMLQAVWGRNSALRGIHFSSALILFWVRGSRHASPCMLCSGIALRSQCWRLPFAALSAALAVLCLVTALQPAKMATNLIYAASIGLLAYDWWPDFSRLPLAGLGAASAAHEPWNMSIKILAALAVLG